MTLTVNGHAPTVLTGIVRIFPLRREDPESWALMPQVLERITRFCATYDTDTKPQELRQAVTAHFVAMPEQQAIQVVVAVMGTTLVGHLILSLDTWCGQIVATIVQYEMDVGAPRQQLRDVLDQVAWWAKQKGASVLRVLAVHTDARGYARARLFRALYGFQPRRVMLDKAL